MSHLDGVDWQEAQPAWRRRLKIGGGAVAGVAAAGLAVASAPWIAAGAVAVGAVGVVVKRQTTSDGCTFNQGLDTELRRLSAAGGRFTLVRRISKRINRLDALRMSSCEMPLRKSFSEGMMGEPGKGEPEKGEPEKGEPPARQVRRRQDLPLLHHDIIVLCLQTPDTHESPQGPDPRLFGQSLGVQRQEWFKMEFEKEGLKYEQSPAEPRVDGQYHGQDCRLRAVDPEVIADALAAVRDRTYNSLTWNCNHVADMLWDTAVTDWLCGDHNINNTDNGVSAVPQMSGGGDSAGLASNGIDAGFVGAAVPQVSGGVHLGPIRSNVLEETD